MDLRGKKENLFLGETARQQWDYKFPLYYAREDHEREKRLLKLCHASLFLVDRLSNHSKTI